MTRLLGIKKWIVSDSEVSGIANQVREYLYQQFPIRGQESFKMLQSVVSCPTQRAPDWWESPRFQALCVAWSWFRQNGVVSSHPPAGNAHRWAASS